MSFEISLREEKSTKRGRKSSKKRKDKESKDQARKSWINQVQQEYLQVTGCMYDSLARFDMHVCVLVFGSFSVIGMDFVGFR